MKKYRINSLAVIAVCIINFSCASAQKNVAKPASLKESFKKDFLIGTALNVRQIEEKDSNAAILVPLQFNAAS
jgi:endo-1,4-beta-xylanase